MQCPKCHAPMHTFSRSGVQIEQCSTCRGIFLDYGELEAITRLESQFPGQQAAPPPPPPPPAQSYPQQHAAPGWGAPHHGHHGHHGHRRKGGLSGLFFSS